MLSCEMRWPTSLGVQGLVWRLGWINWSFLSAIITLAWRVVVVFSFWGWVCSRSLEKRRRLMINGDGAELLKERKGGNGKMVGWWGRRLRREAYGPREMLFERQFGWRWKQIYVVIFGEDRFLVLGEERDR
jgi:hypothetical protein